MKTSMKKNMENLAKEFYRIQTRNWIASQSNGTGGAGQTLEMLLEKAIDRNILPDYHGIELKTKYSAYQPYIGLFSMALDNKPLQMKKLYQLCSWPSRDNPKYNVFYAKITSNVCKCTRKYSFRIHVNYEQEVVELRIFYNYTGKRLNEEFSWSFEQLKLRLQTKLSYLALVHTSKYYDKETQLTYYKYHSIRFYELISFEQFLKALEEGYIRVHIKLAYYKSGPHEGEINDKGTTFEIDENDIEFLFRKLDIQMPI